MAIICFILILFILLLTAYQLYLQTQISRLNHQLKKRLTDQSHHALHVELINRPLNELTANINRCLELERDLQAEIVRNDKNLKTLIANISHDLRTPLTIIKGYQQLLKNSSLSPEQAKKLHISQKYAADLELLINRFFEYSSLIHSEPNYKPEPINLSTYVEQALAEAIPLFEENNLCIHYSAAPKCLVNLDKEALKRIIQNLISNCLAHAKETVTVTIRQTVLQQNTSDNHVQITFSNPIKNPDTPDLEKLFDQFYTGDPSRQITSGLGLSIVKILVKQNGGQVTAQLEEGKLTICLLFPSLTTSDIPGT